MDKFISLIVLTAAILCLSACPADDIPAGCGDGELSTDEECEGFELRGETCVSQGFEEGQLTCSERCTLEVNESCSTCGDLQITGDEVCDAAAVEECTDFGFLGGTLSCNRTCDEINTNGCLGGAGGPCVEGECATNAHCTTPVFLSNESCIAICEVDADCEPDEQCRSLEDDNNVRICAPAFGTGDDALCTPGCVVGACLSCKPPNACENLRVIEGYQVGDCRVAE